MNAFYDYNPLTLGDAQRLFPLLHVRLTLFAYENGFAFTDGDAFRDPRVFGMFGTFMGYGKSHSGHKRRIARDYNIFKWDGPEPPEFNRNGLFYDYSQAIGEWVWGDMTEDHRQTGEYWETLHPLCRWGGRWQDGNHYSLEWEGYR